MCTVNQVQITKADKQHRKFIISLLQAEGLPVEDLPPVLDNFFIAIENNNVIGAIGLECYGNNGLLRSMVVNKHYRNKNIAANLVIALEDRAGKSGIDSIYLLTETAPAYFERKGYKKISRDEEPKPVQASLEFSHVSPVSAIVMKKSLAEE